MKNIIPIVPLVTLISCTQIKHPIAGTYTTLGGDMSGLNADSQGFNFTSNTNSPAFVAILKQIRVMWQSYLIAEGLRFITDHYYDNQGLQIGSEREIMLEELRNAKSLEEGRQALEALRLQPQQQPLL